MAILRWVRFYCGLCCYVGPTRGAHPESRVIRAAGGRIDVFAANGRRRWVENAVPADVYAKP